MSGHGSVAAQVRASREKHPERYCTNGQCLWNVSRSGPCPKHPVAAVSLRCMNCGTYRDDFEKRGGSCEVMEYGDGNSASPSGAYPVPFGHGSHSWVEAA